MTQESGKYRKILVYFQVQNQLLKYFCEGVNDFKLITREILKESKVQYLYLDNNYTTIFQFRVDLIEINQAEIQSDDSQKELLRLWKIIQSKNVTEIMIHITSKPQEKAQTIDQLEVELSKLRRDALASKIIPTDIYKQQPTKHVILGLWDGLKSKTLTSPVGFRFDNHYTLLSLKKLEDNDKIHAILVKNPQSNIEVKSLLCQRQQSDEDQLDDNQPKLIKFKTPQQSKQILLNEKLDAFYFLFAIESGGKIQFLHQFKLEYLQQSKV